MSDVKPFDHRVQIRGADGRTIKENHYSLHIVNGNKYYNRPPQSEHFYTEGGHRIPLDQVPDVCKKHLSGQDQSPEEPKEQKQSFVSKAFDKKKSKKGSEPEADSLV